MKIFLLAFTLLFGGLFQTTAIAASRAEQGWQLIDQGAMLVDVRTPQEFATGHLDNAINYPLSDVATRFTNVDKNQTIVVYCRSGARAAKAQQYLQSQGFSNIHNAGGLSELQNFKTD